MDIISGVFKKELKNRFLCEVEINNELTVCYVPSSCHLTHFLDLNEKEVLLTTNRSKNARTPYALFAMPFKKSYILLSESIANRAIKESIKRRRFSFLGPRKEIYSEYMVENYKTDFFIQDSHTIIEVKSVISIGEEAIFPTVYSERAATQLMKLKEMLISGHKVAYFFVSLNPYIKKISINKASDLYLLYNECAILGMVIKAYTCRYKAERIYIEKEILIQK